VEAGDQYPEEAYESQHKERVVEPQLAARINIHQNACSDEHLFERKRGGQHKRITTTSGSGEPTLRGVHLLAPCRQSLLRSYLAARSFPRRPPAYVLAALAAMLLVAGCLPDPQRVQTIALFDQLVSARATLSGQPPQAEPACTAVGDVQTRLIGEPGLVDIRPAWSALRDAAEALQAVCGQTTMLGQPSTNSPASTLAQDRWQQGIQREIGVACDHLRQAALGLDRPMPC
jgi:hypothetical protein